MSRVAFFGAHFEARRPPGAVHAAELPVRERDATAQLRARLLNMIVANEASRQSPAADSFKPR